MAATGGPPALISADNQRATSGLHVGKRLIWNSLNVARINNCRMKFARQKQSKLCDNNSKEVTNCLYVNHEILTETLKNKTWKIAKRYSPWQPSGTFIMSLYLSFFLEVQSSILSNILLIHLSRMFWRKRIVVSIDNHWFVSKVVIAFLFKFFPLDTYEGHHLTVSRRD